MKKGILLSTVVLLTAVSLTYAQERELHGYIDVTYTGKYIWRGFDIYGDKSAIHPSIDLDLFGTGFGFNATAHRANSSKFENGERWDYTVYYGGSLFQDEPFATNYRFDYVYYNYPDMSSHARSSTDLQEINAILSWPNILPVEGLVPSYVIVKLWPSNSSSIVGSPAPPTGTDGTASGWAHIFMLDYALPIIDPVTNMERTLNLHSELIYNDGVGPNGAKIDHDWSNAVFGVSTNFELAENLVLTPGVYHQVTMDESVNDDKDETWVSVGLKYKF